MCYTVRDWGGIAHFFVREYLFLGVLFSDFSFYKTESMIQAFI